MEETLRYTIQASQLNGTVKLSGAKNSALKLLSASLLTSGKLVIHNYPSSILDGIVHIQMLEYLGKVCELQGTDLTIHEPHGISNKLNWRSRSIRNTLLILGALVARTGYGSVPLPGGCQLGTRKYDIHEMLLKKFGAAVTQDDGFLTAESNARLQGTDIHLPIRSTGATENAVICATLAEGVTRIWNPHVRPELLDMISFLRSMGAQIEVYGQEHIRVEGVDGLSGTNHFVIPDNMEAITWVISSVVTGGDLEILTFPFKHLEVPMIHLRESGARFYSNDSSLIVRGGCPYPIDISTGPFPGINSDMQPLFAVFGLCAKGQSRIVDLRFPGRYEYSLELKKMGAQIDSIDNVLNINGGTKLSGTTVRALDLRAGAALSLAGLVAEGTTVIEDGWQIDRGYDNFFEKLSMLGGRICRENV